MKIFKLSIFALILTFTSSAIAQNHVKEIDGYDVFIDSVFLRPMGFVGLIVGTATFVAISPMAAIATIPKPHNAFPALAKTLIVRPAKYTFTRPVGDYNYE